MKKEIEEKKSLEYETLMHQILKEESLMFQNRTEVLMKENEKLALELSQVREELQQIITSKAYRYSRKIADLVRHK